MEENKTIQRIAKEKDMRIIAVDINEEYYHIGTALEEKGGITNYFIICDIGNGTTCEKCNSIGAIILLLDKNLTSNFYEKTFVPALETYYNLGIEPESSELLRYPPVPINPKTDYWYCPYCNEMHKISDFKKTRIIYDQEVVNVKVDMSKHLKKDKDLEVLERIVSGKIWS